MYRLFITVKDRPQELAILCKSLLHSDMRRFINEVIFLDDHSEEQTTIHRIYSAFMYAMIPLGIKTRFLLSKDGRSGINESWDRIKHYGCDRIWMLNGDMLVLSRYFSECAKILEYGEKTFSNKSVIVSGFNTPIHPITRTIPLINANIAPSVGGCSEVTYWKNLDKLLECFGTPKTMNRGWDLHIGEVFDKILVANPSQSQHIGILTGLNQLQLSGFPGAWATL